MAAPKLNPDSPLNDGLLAWYLAHPAYFDGTVWPDLSGNGHDGSLLQGPSGGVPWDGWDSAAHTSGVASVLFAGSTTNSYRVYVESVGNVIRANSQSNLLTLCAWFRTDAALVRNHIFDIGFYAGRSLTLNVDAVTSGSVRIVYGGQSRDFAGAGVVVGEWTMVAATIDATTGKTEVFLDGVFVGEITIAVPPEWVIAPNPALIGAEAKDRTRGLAGRISDVRIYSRVLPPTEIADYYAESLGGYESVLLPDVPVLSSPHLASHFDPSQLVSSPHLLGSFP